MTKRREARALQPARAGLSRLAQSSFRRRQQLFPRRHDDIFPRSLKYAQTRQAAFVTFLFPAQSLSRQGRGGRLLEETVNLTLEGEGGLPTHPNSAGLRSGTFLRLTKKTGKPKH